MQVQEVPAASVPEGAWLLDVREDDEWAAGYAPGARHIPLGELGARAAEVPQDEAVYVICRSGGRQRRLADDQRRGRHAELGSGWPPDGHRLRHPPVRRLARGPPARGPGLNRIDGPWVLLFPHRVPPMR